MSRPCVPSITENPLRLSPLFRDYWGEQMARFTERTDFISQKGCYVPRFYHAPDSEQEAAGLGPNDYRPYLLSLPIGSFIVGFNHTTSSAPNSQKNEVVTNASGFTMQITDLAIDHKWFSRPAEEAYFINDALLIAPNDGGNPPYPDNTQGFTFPSFTRLLPVPYPVVPPGQFQVEFWNSLDVLNDDVQMTFLVMVPDGVNGNARKGSSK